MPKFAVCSTLALLLIGTPAVAAAQLVTRDGPDKVTVRASRLTSPLKLDGRLDEEFYETVEPIHDFIQQEPKEGAPVTERTDAWVFFDNTQMYVSARLWDSHPELEVADEMQHDSQNMTGNENVIIVLDTYHDRRNGFFFQTNPLGGMRDVAIIDEAQYNSWNGVWDVRTGKFDGGWTVEFAIPFKTLRYAGAGEQEWGFNLRRIVRWKNEAQYLSLVPAAFGNGGAGRVSSAATLVGMETPAQSMNLELKPHAESSLTTDRTAAVPFSNDFKPNAGLDVKYGLTRSLIADLTINPDFAQVEEDVQQVNLTRFSLFFPEKRGFFLEGQGIFDFGGVSGNNVNGNVPLLFFSRQIGLSRGQDVPVGAGGRVTGKAGKFSVGALNIGTADKKSIGALATNFTAVRVKRELLGRSSIGVIGTHRNLRSNGTGSNTTLGVDAAFNFLRTITMNTYFAQTDTTGVKNGAATSSYRARFDYNADRYGFNAERLFVGERFNPEVGYVRRQDLDRNSLSARFSPRPKRNARIRKFSDQGGFTYLQDAHRTSKQESEVSATFSTEFQNSDMASIDYSRNYELLPEPFRIAPRVTVPVGGYDYYTTTLSYTLGQQRRVAGNVSFATGTLYGGTKRSLTYTRARVVVLPRWIAVEPGVTLNWVDLPFGTFTASVLNARTVFTPTPRLGFSSLVQYNGTQHTLTSSVRMRWEYNPGSELFVVYSDGRDTLAPGFPDMLNRSIAMKVTRLVRF